MNGSKFELARRLATINRLAQKNESSLAHLAIGATGEHFGNYEKLLAVIASDTQSHGVAAKRGRPILKLVHLRRPLGVATVISTLGLVGL